MITRLVKLLVLVPVAILLVVLSVANRHSVTLALNPFQPDDKVLSLTLPFFIYLFLAVILGVVIGSMATWFSQGKHRKRARNEANEARKWRDEASRARTRIEEVSAQKMLSASSS